MDVVDERRRAPSVSGARPGQAPVDARRQAGPGPRTRLWPNPVDERPAEPGRRTRLRLDPLHLLRAAASRPRARLRLHLPTVRLAPLPAGASPAARRALRSLLGAVALIGLGLLLADWTHTPAPWPVLAAAETGPASARVDFLNVGRGHAVLVRAGGATALIDGGPAAAGQPLVTWLEQQGIDRLADVVLTSPADAATGGLIPVLQALPVGRLLDGGWTADCALYRSVVALARHRAVPVQRLDAGSTLDLAPGVRLEALLPAAGSPPPANDSVVLRLVDGGVAMLLPGLMGPAQEAQLLRSGRPLQAQVLEVPRHGAAGSIGSGLLEAVRPTVAVVAVPGGDPSLPDASAMGRLAAAGVAILRSDVHGTVEITTDGRALDIRLESSPPLPGNHRTPTAGGFALPSAAPRTGRGGGQGALMPAGAAVVSCAQGA